MCEFLKNKNILFCNHSKIIKVMKLNVNVILFSIP